MLFLGKYYQILLFLLTFMCQSTQPSSQNTIAVFFNTGNSQNSSTATFPVAIKKSFEKLPSTLGIDGDANIVYKDFNSTFCDLETFLEFVDGILDYHVIVVLLLEDCQCEKKFMSYLDILNIRSVSNCERPLFAANVTSSIIKHIRQERQLYLTVPVDADGVEFYQNFTFELQRQKLKLNRTLWIGKELAEEIRLEKELTSVAENIENNITSGATFVIGFLHPNDFRLKTLVNMVQRVLGKQLGKIFWIFPVIHLDFSKFQTFDESFQMLAFGERNLGTVDCDDQNQICDLYVVLGKASYVLESSLNTHRANLMKNIRNTTAAKCSAQKVKRRHLENSGKNQAFMISQLANFYVDVLQTITDRYFKDITWKRVGMLTWESDSVQPYLSEDVFNDAILSPKVNTIFRVSIVEDYYPFVLKHELNGFSEGCPPNALPCYGQSQKADNTTVINYSDKYCCSGWTVDILIYLTDKLSYEFELYFQAEQAYGIYDDKTGAWNGVVQDLISGKADIAVDLTVRPDRCAVLDCSLGYISDGFNAILKQESSQKDRNKKGGFEKLIGTFKVFGDPFSGDLSIAVLVTFNVLMVLIWATDKVCLFYRNKRPGRKTEKFTILESMSYVWAIAFGRDAGDSKKPLTLSARYLASWLAFLSLILVNVYVARLMAELVKEEITKPFTSLRDPRISNNKLKLGVTENSATEAYFQNTRDPVLKQLFENNIKENLLPSVDEGVKAVKNSIIDGFLGTTTTLKVAVNQDSNCSLSLMGRDFSESPIAFMFRKDWPWAEEFKREELRMNEIKREEDFWRMRNRLRSCKVPSEANPQLSIADMSGFFLVIVFTIVYCCFSLIVENICSFLVYRYQHSYDSWNVPRA